MQHRRPSILFVSPLVLSLGLWAGCSDNGSSQGSPSGSDAGQGGSEPDSAEAGAPSDGGATTMAGSSGSGGDAGELGGEAGVGAGGDGNAAGVPNGAGGAPSNAAGAGSGGEADGGGPNVAQSVQVLSITPGDHEEHVAPLTNIVIQLSGPIDPDSLRVPPQLLAPKASKGLVAEVSYDPSTFTITIDPALPLVAGGVHRVDLGGITDLHGNVLELKSDFRVAFQSITLVRYYSLEGQQTSGSLYKLTDEGRSAVRIDFAKPGDDGEVGTADDVISGYYQYDWSKVGENCDISYFNGEGADKTWFTGDDLQAGRSFTSKPVLGENHSGNRGAGQDGKWNTKDDPWTSLCRSSFTSDGRESNYFCFSSAGEDATPFNDDDPLSYYYLDSFSAGVEPYESGSVQTRPYYSGPGKDGTWLTEDDPVGSFNQYRYDADQFAQLVLTMDAGADAIAYTKDDTTSFALGSKRDEQGLLLSRVKLLDPGKDGQWQTDDDTPGTAFWKYKYESDGRLVWMGMYDAGKDLIPGSDDDLLVYEELHDSPL